MAVYVAKRSFWLSYEGREHLIRAGTTVRGGHPMMKGHEDKFAPLQIDYDYEVPRRAEQATAAPDERRSVTPAAVKKAPPKSDGD